MLLIELYTSALHFWSLFRDCKYNIVLLSGNFHSSDYYFFVVDVVPNRIIFNYLTCIIILQCFMFCCYFFKLLLSELLR